MKRMVVYFIILYAVGCNNNDERTGFEGKIANKHSDSNRQNFFPVTNYLKGQVRVIKTGGVNPLKIITINDHKDSSWIKMEDLDYALADYFKPEIDTLNLKKFFRETKFLDQTLDAFTFTYEPIGILPDSLNILRWDVYIDPTTSMVKRVYVIKKEGDKTVQLTWQNNEWCKSITISEEGKIEKEELIKWKF